MAKYTSQKALRKPDSDCFIWQQNYFDAWHGWRDNCRISKGIQTGNLHIYNYDNLIAYYGMVLYCEVKTLTIMS